MKITILIEGKTERAFIPHLRAFLRTRLAGPMPNIDPFPCDGRIYKEAKLRKTVEDLLRNGKVPSDAVIALTDVYTGANDFVDAADAKRKMRAWVGPNDRFYPHAAQYDFEKPGCFRFGMRFRGWQDTGKACRPDRPKR